MVISVLIAFIGQKIKKFYFIFNKTCKNEFYLLHKRYVA